MKSFNYDVNRSFLLAADEELWRIVIWKDETDTEYFAESQGLALQLIYNQAMTITAITFSEIICLIFLRSETFEILK